MSALLAMRHRRLMAARDWAQAYWMVSDEALIEDALFVLYQSHHSATWHIEKVATNVIGPAGEYKDAEALAYRDGYVYIVGSHFGKKRGPLERKRQFIARFAEPSEADGGGPLTIDMQVAHDGFGLHRLINDALRHHRIDLVPQTAVVHDAYIQATRVSEEDRDRQIDDHDRPINIEGVAFTNRGTLLLGLRYPVTADGHPVIIEMAGVESLFDQTGALPRVVGLWIMPNAGRRDEAVGVRAIDRHGRDLHVITGTIDGSPQISLLLAEHPQGATAYSAHHICRPGRQSTGRITSRQVRTLAPQRAVEGIAVNGSKLRYIVDDEHSVPVLSRALNHHAP